LAQSPTMLVARTTRGAIVVRVYKRYGGKRLMRNPSRLPPPGPAVQPPLRAGSTRWVLESESAD
jgi:hypothetical protein